MGDTVRAGFDYFHTVEAETRFDFRDRFAIPGGFFEPGSQAISSTVVFRGLELGEYRHRRTGTTDTVVERLQDADLPAPYPRHATIPIRVVALSLASAEPIEVEAGGSRSRWDVRATLSQVHRHGHAGALPLDSTMTITKTGAAGGTFESDLTVVPRFTFLRRGDDEVRVLDVGELAEEGLFGDVPPEELVSAMRFHAAGVEWWTEPPDEPDDEEPVADPADEFFPCSRALLPTVEMAAFARHGVRCGRRRRQH